MEGTGFWEKQEISLKNVATFSTLDDGTSLSPLPSDGSFLFLLLQRGGH
jgi:hypothetical protein